ncbi:MAG: hypothetical protein Phog2KO_06130 [Phototrophicaceae bacterium]
MTQPQQPAHEDIGGVLKRVHLLGSATEDLFNRVYGGLNRRKKFSEAMEELDKVEVRNRQLRNALKEKSIETQRLTGILASISEGIVMQDTDGRIVMINSAAEDILGSIRNFWATELGVLFRKSRDIPSIGNEIVPLGEAKQVTINNRNVSAQITSISDDNDERIGTLMILRTVEETDISARMKDSFVTHISHELITPLAPMRVASEILLHTPEGKAPNRRMLEMIGKNVDILDRLVTEMLDMSAMTSGNFQIQREEISLEELVLDIISGFKPDLDDGKLEVFLMLKHSQDLSFRGDRKNLRWAMSNIVRNAIQYTQANKGIWISVGSERDKPHEIFFEVSDAGVGISDEDKPHIFDLFFRGDARTVDGNKLDPRGLGQGLFVAKTIAQAHNGTLTVESEVHEGSTFRMILPRNIPKALPS